MKIQRVVLFLSLFVFFSPVRSDNTNIIINEIGAYEASGFEWLEIFNRGVDPIDLTGWKFWENNINHALALKQGPNFILDPGEFAIITQDDKKFLERYPQVTSTILDSSWTTLSEDGEDLGLKFGTGENDFVERFTYIATDNFSLERKDPNQSDYTLENWVEHESGNTVGAKNSVAVEEAEEEENLDPEIVPVNQTPIAAFLLSSSSIVLGTAVSFDASGSSDIDGLITSYTWNFGNGSMGEGVQTQHVYTATGTFMVELTVIDDLGSGSTATSSVEVLEGVVPIEESVEELQDELVPDETPVGENSPAPTSTPKLLINEFLADPEEEKEWIELLNIGTSTVDLVGFTLSDGVGSIANPTSSMDAGGFLVVELNSSKLNNAGDRIIVQDASGIVLDSVTYGSYDDGNLEDNAAVPAKGNSMARKGSEDTQSDTHDFQETTTPTKGTANILTAPLIPEKKTTASKIKATSPSSPSRVSIPPSTPHFSAGDIVINELLSDPGEEHQEFVELYNRTTKSISLSGWKLQDGSGANTLLEGNIGAHKFFVIEKPKGNLNNNGDTVILLDPSGSTIDTVSFGDWNDGVIEDNASVASDPMSLARTVDGGDTNNDAKDFAPTLKVTVGNPNHINTPKVLDPHTEVASAQIIINEVLPNPTGDDSETEFIELYNPTTSSVSLVGWKIGDNTQKRYTIQKKVIAPHGYAVFLRKITGISLNNTGKETVTLFDSQGKSIDSLTITYEKSAGEDETYARDENNIFVWTTTQTSGSENIFTQLETDDNEGFASSDPKAKATITKKSPKKVLGKKIVAVMSIPLEKIREQDTGTLLQTTGIVAVEPGVFGSQYFYIVNDTSGVQVYNNKKDFPELKIGDLVEVEGEMTEAYGETRVKTQRIEDMVVIDHPGQSLPQEVEIASIGELLEGALVKITGQVTEVKAANMYVDDGTSEIKVYFKSGTGIHKEDVALGSTVTVEGIVAQVSGGYQLLPRTKTDIVLKEAATEEVVTKDHFNSGGKNSMKNFLTAVFGGTSIILLGVLAKRKL